MKTRIFEQLEEAGLIKRGKLQNNAISNMPYVRVIDLLDNITEIAAKTEITIKSSLHTHCASFGLGGSRDECWGLECRLKAANELARFAALYSDNVIIHNYLADFSPTWGHPPDEDTDEFRQDLFDDFYILLQLRPLIEAGRILVFTPPATTCPYCYAKDLFGAKADHRLRQAVKHLAHDLYKKSTVEFYQTDIGYESRFTQDTDLFRHQSFIHVYDTLPESLANETQLLQQINDGKVVTLTDRSKQKLGIHDKLATNVLTSIRYQMSVADAIGASFLTHRNVDMELLAYISNSDEIRKRNAMVAQYLKTIVPFAEDVPIHNLIRLREREEASFLQFRSALDTALQQVMSKQNIFTETDAQALYEDIIAPEIAKLDQKVREAKRDLVKSPLISAAGTFAIIAFGLYAGMIPAELKEVAEALGLVNIIYNTFSKTVDVLDTEKSVRPEKFYFLWKVKYAVKKTKRSDR